MHKDVKAARDARHKADAELQKGLDAKFQKDSKAHDDGLKVAEKKTEKTTAPSDKASADA